VNGAGMGARILVVEDTSYSLQLMTYLLTAQGHAVAEAVTGEQAIEIAPAWYPDLVVMDLQLPGMDGYQALTALRVMPELTAVPIVAVTSFAMVGDRERALEAGFSHYMTKPIDPETFTAEINTRLPERLRGAAPVPAGDVLEPAPAAEPVGTLVSADILVLDDSVINQTLLRSVLEPHGYRVRTACTVEEAIAAAAERRPDLVLSDVHVGQERGADLRAYLSSVPHLAIVPFAFVTATANQVGPRVGDGRTRVILRPIDPPDLLDEVRALLSSRIGD
jgi:two-component system cell cycle response regulator